MARKKLNKFLSVFKIFFSSINTYFMYLDKTAKQLAFPVFGIIIGIIILFAATYYFSINLDNIKNISSFFQDDNHILITFYVLIAPVFIVFLKAIYDYSIILTSQNLLFYTVSNKKKVKDVDLNANNKIIERKILKYTFLMLIYSLILITPPLIFISPVLFIFLCLTFQVFAFENDNSVFKCISRSIELVKGNVIPTVILILLCFLTTYCFIPSLFIWTSDKISLSLFLVNQFEKFFNIIPFDEINDILSIMPVQISIDSIILANLTVKFIIYVFSVFFTLPFRCCCFTELYKLYDSDKIKEISKSADTIIKRAVGKDGKK